MIYIIYKISIANQCYIGSTKDFKQRKMTHKSICNSEINLNGNKKVYQIVRENGGWDCCEMKPIEEFECEGQLQAQIREEYWIREYKATLNMRQAHRTEEEEKEYNRSQSKINYQANKDKILQNNKTKITCDCGSCISRRELSTHLKTKKHQNFLNKNIAIVNNE